MLHCKSITPAFNFLQNLPFSFYWQSKQEKDGIGHEEVSEK